MINAKNTLTTEDYPPHQKSPLLNVAFVGAFTSKANDGTVGGQMYACRSLLESSLSLHVKWRLIDSTMKSLPPPSLGIRCFYAVKRISGLIKLLIAGKADALLIFTSYNFSSFLEKGIMCLLGRAFGSRVVLSIRSEVKMHKGDIWFNLFRRLVFKKAKVVICQSEAARHNIANLLKISLDNLTVISNWIDPTRYTSARLSNRCNSKHRTFIYLGWLEACKGIYDLMEAVKLLSDKGYSFRLIVCGGGGELTAVAEVAKRFMVKERIEFRGWVMDEEKIKTLGESDVFVLPSYSEGVPNSLLESMASGLPVIATPVGGITGIVESGINGFLVNPGNVEDLASAMEYFILNPEKIVEMGKVNFEKISECHDIRHVWIKVAKALGLLGAQG